MSTVVEIANMALGYVGDQTVNSIDPPDPNKRARLCALYYDAARRRALRMHPWTCVSKRALVIKDAADPEWGFANRFEMPSDFERLTFIRDQTDETPYEVVGNFVETDLSSPLAVKYVWNDPDTTHYDALLTTVVAYSLALDLVEPLTQSNTKKEKLEDALVFWLKQATSVNGSERRPGKFKDTSYLRARRTTG